MRIQISDMPRENNNTWLTALERMVTIQNVIFRVIKRYI